MLINIINIISLHMKLIYLDAQMKKLEIKSEIAQKSYCVDKT